MTLAFKNAAHAAAVAANPLEKLFSLEIARVTGGPFSHVEMWLDGRITAARCFSSREPGGTQFATIDLSDAGLWTMVDIPYPPIWTDRGACDAADFAWCQGRENRRYNFVGIMAIEFGGAITSPHDDFCSQCCFEFLQDRRGMLKWARTDWIAPSGFGKDGKRWGLYELVTCAQKLPA